MASRTEIIQVNVTPKASLRERERALWVAHRTESSEWSLDWKLAVVFLFLLSNFSKQASKR